MIRFLLCLQIKRNIIKRHFLTADYPKMTIIPTVVVDLILGPVIQNLPGFEESLQTAFSCGFRRAESEYYDIQWYINEQIVTTFKNVLIDNIEDTNLTESDWVGKYRLNMIVSYIKRYTFTKDNYNIAECIQLFLSWSIF